VNCIGGQPRDGLLFVCRGDDAALLDLVDGHQVARERGLTPLQPGGLYDEDHGNAEQFETLGPALALTGGRLLQLGVPTGSEELLKHTR
jgi:hypothetical protein